MAERFYFTTPIYYVSDVPHLGHAYTTVVGDALARYHRLRGHATGYLTGTDEHGQKIERMAKERGKSTRQYVDEIAAAYQEAWRRLHVDNDDFIRTTDADHEAVVQEVWRRMEERGDLYLGHYEGWYCVACEQFFTEKELAPGSLCAVHGRPVEKVKEESYFFRLSAYQKPLQELYDRVKRDTGRPFVEPEVRMNEVRAFVDAGLDDLSVSRTSFSWGVPVPGRERHVIYVWLDALTNYYSATRRRRLDGFWDEDVNVVHIMGKEITRFHAVYWPAMLLAAGLRPPSKILAHGWWTVDGEKMSKTRGNVVDPLRLCADLDAAAGAPVGSDAFRYFVLREVPLGADGDFSHQALLTRYNAELANDLGNLVNRTLGMAHKYCGAEVRAGSDEPRGAAENAIAAAARHLDDYAPSRALEAIWQLVRELNTFIDQAAPWKQSPERKEAILGAVLEGCRILAHLLWPFLPERAVAMLRELGRDELPAWPAWEGGRHFRVPVGRPLFPRLDEAHRVELLARWTPPPGEPESSSPAPTVPAPPANTPLKAEIAYAEFAKLDLRVGVIRGASRVPKKDKLLLLTVDLGAESRQVVAGIAATYDPDRLLGKKVIFLANLKPAKIGGVLSQGMILAAGDAEVLALSALDGDSGRDCPPGTVVR